MPKQTLTGNDLARAEGAAALAIAWWEKQAPVSRRSAFARKEIAAYRALISKLSAIGDHAYPYEPDTMPSDCGDDPIMQLDAEVVRETRAAARRARRAA